MRIHTCSHPIERDGKSKLNGHRFGFLQQGIDCIQVFISQSLEIGQHVMCIWVGRDLAFENLR